LRAAGEGEFGFRVHQACCEPIRSHGLRSTAFFSKLASLRRTESTWRAPPEPGSGSGRAAGGRTHRQRGRGGSIFQSVSKSRSRASPPRCRRDWRTQWKHNQLPRPGTISCLLSSPAAIAVDAKVADANTDISTAAPTTQRNQY